MKAFVINLERAVERRTKVTRQLKRRKLDYEIVRAIDGKQLSDDELKRLCDLEAVKANPRKLTIGAIGCALSHLEAYRRILAEDLEMALVLEDDPILPHDILELLEAVKKQIQPNEVVMLYYGTDLPDNPTVSQRGAVTLSKRYSLMYPVNFSRGSVAYVITKEAARSMAEKILPIRVESDDWTYFFNNNYFESLRCVAPIPVRITGEDTQIRPLLAPEPFRKKITGFIDRRKIPILYQLLVPYRAIRCKLEAQQAEVIDAPSPVWERLKKH